MSGVVKASAADTPFNDSTVSVDAPTSPAVPTPGGRRGGRLPRAVDEGAGQASVAEPKAVGGLANVPQLRKILLAIRGASQPETRLPMAELLVQTFGAELVLLSILPPDAVARDDRMSPQQAQATAYLEMMSASMHAQGRHAHGLLLFASSPADAIVAEAEETGADLIIMGVSTAGGLSRAFQSNVSVDVARRAPCPVLLIQQGAFPKRASQVRSFDADSAVWGPLARWNLGVRPVVVAHIVGSVGRAGEAMTGATLRGSNQVPTERRQRYQRVLIGMRTGVALPAVELYKLGSTYYVLDGNHRIAAARELGQAEIDADVTEFVPLGDDAAQRVFAERRAFERHTGLKDIESAHVPGTYPSLTRMFEAFVKESEVPASPDLARRWHTQFYLPLSRTIRERDLLRHYPGEYVADVVVRIASYRRHIARRQGRELDWPEAISIFIKKKIPRDKKAVLGHSHGGRRGGGPSEQGQSEVVTPAGAGKTA